MTKVINDKTTKTNKGKPTETLALSRADLRASVIPAGFVPSGVGLAGDAFDGETFAGLNILKLEEGKAAGPFAHVKTVIQKMKKKGKIKPGEDPEQDVEVFIATHLSDHRREFRMPIAAAFIKKAKEDAKLEAGDVYLVKRTANYTDKVYKQTCQGFELKVLARAANKENIAKLVALYTAPTETE
jgi:hypothetical protein